MGDKPFAYICSPFRGDMRSNAERARGYSRQVLETGYIPLAPHLLFPQFLNENIPREREAGMEMGAALLSQCRVLVVCGKGISEGMAREIDMAERLHIPIYTLDAFINMPESERRCHQGRIMSVPMPNDAKARTGFPVPAGKPSVLERIAGVWRLQNRERRETPASVKSKPHGSER